MRIIVVVLFVGGGDQRTIVQTISVQHRCLIVQLSPTLPPIDVSICSTLVLSSFSPTYNHLILDPVKIGAPGFISQKFIETTKPWMK